MPRLRVQVGGLIGGVSAWSVTTEYALSGDVASLAQLQTIATALQTALSTSTAFKTGICLDTTCVNPKLLFYPTGSSVATLVAQGTGAAFTGSPVAIHAPQVAVVASLRTDQAGASRRGRSYLPYRASNVAATGVVNTAGQTAVANCILALRTQVITAVAAQSLAATWIVWSPKLQSGAPITGVLVGSRCDTIRHRVSGVPEVYQASSVPPVVLSFAEGDDEAQAILDAVANSSIVPIDEALKSKGGFWKTAYDVIPTPAP